MSRRSIAPLHLETGAVVQDSVGDEIEQLSLPSD